MRGWRGGGEYGGGGGVKLTKIADSLPDGWTIQIDLRKGSSSVTMRGPSGEIYKPNAKGGCVEVEIGSAEFFVRNYVIGLKGVRK